MHDRRATCEVAVAVMAVALLLALPLAAASQVQVSSPSTSGDAGGASKAAALPQAATQAHTAADAVTCAGTTCASCTSTPGCGWCQELEQCLPSTGGPPPSCPSSAWAPTLGACRNLECADISGVTCDSCVGSQLDYCGWCEKTQKCMYGTSAGAYDGTCEATSGFSDPWKWDNCETGCEALTDCLDCAAEPKCGWCFLTQICRSGTADGSTGGTCTQTNWRWTSNECCSQYSQCDDCTSEPVCGWCAGSGKCYSGTIIGPNGNIACTDTWDYDGSGCNTSGLSSGIEIMLALIIPLFVLSVIASFVIRYCRRRRRANTFAAARYQAFDAQVEPLQLPGHTPPPLNITPEEEDVGAGAGAAPAEDLTGPDAPLFDAAHVGGVDAAAEAASRTAGYGSTGFTFDHHPAFAPVASPGGGEGGEIPPRTSFSGPSSMEEPPTAYLAQARASPPLRGSRLSAARRSRDITAPVGGAFGGRKY